MLLKPPGALATPRGRRLRRKGWIAAWSAAAFVWLLAPAARGQIHQLVVDFHQTNGHIRPLHGVNGGPLCYRGTLDLSAYHRELAVPLTRLHDVVWVNAEAVDIHTVFPEFRNDPARADSYRFAATDDYVQAILEAGSRIVYRLGESIEHTPRKYWVHPPADPEKWAQICLGIIWHYNEGWANGFRHDIRYWEIWNEPDVRPQMWTGTEEEFFRLYTVTAKAIKARFPEVKVGGPGLGNTGQLEGQRLRPAAFLNNFLAHCREHGAPLDFFSWHRYTSDPWDLARRARAVRRLLDEQGFHRTESHLNEWNYLPNDDWRPMTREGQGAAREAWCEEMGGPAGAAFAAGALSLLQDAPLDAANFFTGEVQCFGLFNFHGVPKKTFHAFKAFRAMLETPVRIGTEGAVEGQIAVLSGVNAARDQAGLLVSNYRGTRERFQCQLRHPPWPGRTRFAIAVVTAEHNLEEVQRGILEAGAATPEFKLKAPGVALVRLRSE